MIADPDLLQTLTDLSPDQGASQASIDMIVAYSDKFTVDVEFHRLFFLKELEFKFNFLESQRLQAQNQFDILSARAIDNSDAIFERLLKRKIKELNNLSREIIMIDNLLNNFGITRKLRNNHSYLNSALQSLSDDDVNCCITYEPDSNESSPTSSLEERRSTSNSTHSVSDRQRPRMNASRFRELRIRSRRKEISSDSGEFQNDSLDSISSKDSETKTPVATRKAESKPMSGNQDQMRTKQSSCEDIFEGRRQSFSSIKLSLNDLQTVTEDRQPSSKSSPVMRAQSAQASDTSTSRFYLKNNASDSVVSGMVTLPRKKQPAVNKLQEQPDLSGNNKGTASPGRVHRIKKQLFHGSKQSIGEQDAVAMSSFGTTDNGTSDPNSRESVRVRNRIHMFEELSSKVSRSKSNPAYAAAAAAAANSSAASASTEGSDSTPVATPVPTKKSSIGSLHMYAHLK